MVVFFLRGQSREGMSIHDVSRIELRGLLELSGVRRWLMVAKHKIHIHHLTSRPSLAWHSLKKKKVTFI